jgi:uncharacterized protein DUF4337
MTMSDIPETKNNDGNSIDTWVGLCVVLLATFLGVANVKDDNIVQQMQLKQADRNDNWNWFQARKIRATVLEAFADELTVAWPNETPEVAKQRLEKSTYFRARAKDQEDKAKEQENDAKKAAEEYQALNAKDDQFDLCEAALAIGLALMGVTALIKRWWLFVVALIPSAFGILMGFAGFMGIDTNSDAINWIVKVLS